MPVKCLIVQGVSEMSHRRLPKRAENWWAMTGSNRRHPPCKDCKLFFLKLMDKADLQTIAADCLYC